MTASSVLHRHQRVSIRAEEHHRVGL